jgi:hypothetical protein
MHIDKTHRPWAGWAAAIVLIGAVIYAIYAAESPGGPAGGSFWGLVFGSVGYGFMLYAGFLGIRKRMPVRRLGKTKTWMRGHLWLGGISLILILYHGGFAFRGPLTMVMMILFFIVIGSGLVGAALQHYLPRMMLLQVRKETIYEEIPHVRAQLWAEAERLIAANVVREEVNRAVDKKWDEPVTVAMDAEEAGLERLRDAYARRIRPFLQNPTEPNAELSVESRADQLFQALRVMVPPALHDLVGELEGICDEERQLIRQASLYRWLHGWLLVHVPLSVALLVLGGVLAIVALRY